MTEKINKDELTKVESKEDANSEISIDEKEQLRESETHENSSEKSSSKDHEENQKLEKSVEGLEKELEEVKDKMLRVLAENENIRKQSEKNRIEVIKYGVQPLAREMVDVVDNFERALSSLKGTEEKTLEGFELIYKEIVQILEKFNIKKIESLGMPFDANYHQAMFEKPTKQFKPGTVCEIVQDGYKFHDRLLRPAMVGIGKSEESEEENNNMNVENREAPPVNESEKK